MGDEVAIIACTCLLSCGTYPLYQQCTLRQAAKRVQSIIVNLRNERYNFVQPTSIAPVGSVPPSGAWKLIVTDETSANDESKSCCSCCCPSYGRKMKNVSVLTFTPEGRVFGRSTDVDSDFEIQGYYNHLTGKMQWGEDGPGQNSEGVHYELQGQAVELQTVAGKQMIPVSGAFHRVTGKFHASTGSQGTFEMEYIGDADCEVAMIERNAADRTFNKSTIGGKIVNATCCCCFSKAANREDIPTGLRQGDAVLQAEHPAGWQVQHQASTGATYYTDHNTGEVSLTSPALQTATPVDGAVTKEPPVAVKSATIPADRPMTTAPPDAKMV